jgi:hypothetical protein
VATVLTKCRECDREHELTPEAIRPGTWPCCPECSLAPTTRHIYQKCTRPLRLTSRTLCVRCMGVNL